MELTHIPADPDRSLPRRLASTVDTAETTVERALGLMFQPTIPDDYALAFRFPRCSPQVIHMIGVPITLDVIWVTGTTVTQTAQLSPMIGIGRAEADCVFELPPDTAADVAVGDTVRLTSAESPTREGGLELTKEETPDVSHPGVNSETLSLSEEG